MLSVSIESVECQWNTFIQSRRNNFNLLSKLDIFADPCNNITDYTFTAR